MTTIHREIGLTLYRWATGAARSRLVRSFAELKMFPACILFYHRVAQDSMNDWSIPVDNFEWQMDWIQANAVPASLDEIRQTQLLGSRATRMVGVTFDDAYSENCEYAIPYLLARKIPITYFVTTYFVETGEPFPHDVARGTILKPNTIAEIRKMADHGVQIGGHSHTHANFGIPMSKKQLRTEITDVRKRLQDWTGQSIDYFAFPYGGKQHITQEAVDMIFESGYQCFVSACGGVNWPGQDADHLQRVHGDPGIAAVKNCLTFDPRKIYKATPVQYSKRTPNPASETTIEPSLHAVR